MPFLKLGDTAPDFEVDTQIGKIKFHEFIGSSWSVFFSHPKDNTPVCTTELGSVSKFLPDFTKRNVKPIALSVDSVEDHKGWIKDINEVNNTEVTYPIIADPNREIATLYGMLDETNKDNTGMPLTVRSVFIIDPAKKIRLILTYPASCGRNFHEILRVIDSLQLTDSHKVTTPANWNKGDDVIVAPSVSNDDAQKLFGEFTTVKPYLRTIKYEQLQKKD